MTEKDSVTQKLKEVKYPGYTRDIVSFGMVKNIEVVDKNIYITLKDLSGKEEIKKEIEGRIKIALGNENVEVQWEIEGDKVKEKASPFIRKHIENVNKIITIASGKGGVGKSTVSANLAGAFSSMGIRVSILDADIYGPNIPTIFDIKDTPTSPDGKKIIPVEFDGIQVMSIGFFLNKEDAVIWRGPLVMRAVQQFIDDIIWKDTDILVVDLPPGTGDVQLTLIQNLYIDGAVLVTTPETMAVEDARRANTMFAKVDVPVIGVIENMSYFKCPECGHIEKMFESEEYKKFLDESHLKVLAQLPVNKELASNNKNPLLKFSQKTDISKLFIDAAEKIKKNLNL